MSMLKSATIAPFAFAVAALLAACSSGASQSAPASGLGIDSFLHVPGTLARPDRPGRLFLGVKWTGHIHRDHRKSWISPDAQRFRRILFGTDVGTGDVYMLAMPQMSLVGTITGFVFPQGECSDRQGNIWIADTDADQVLEYSRTGTLLNTIVDSYGFPQSCAINPINNAIAVADGDSLDGSPGQVLIYSSPSSSPTVLTNPTQTFYEFLGYDPSGDLWVDGFGPEYGIPIVSSCGASSCSTINLSGGTIGFPGAIQWDNVRNTWVIFDQFCMADYTSCSYPLSGSGVLGTPTMYSNFNGGPACDIVQGVIAAFGRRYATGADYDYCGYSRSSFSRWPYPAGGTPTHHTIDVAIPVGAAISTK
ncbi:MAG: hypothetical protein WCC84_06900 [Candidatus Cybelea sp.]